MNIGIRSVSVYRPSDSIDNIVQGGTLDASADFIADKIGMLKLARKDAAQDSSDLGYCAAIQLLGEQGLRADQVECLVMVTQNPDRKGLPHSSAILHHKLGLSTTCAVFDISLGCSGFVHALAVAKSFMESQGFRNGLLVTADPYSKIIDTHDRDTALLFGDGASATWLSDTPLWNIGAADFGIQSAQHAALHVKADGTLTMNGRAVFSFAATEVPASISRVLGKSGFSMNEIDLVLLHQGSRYIVETLAKRIGSEGKTPFAATQYGNTISSSIPMLLADQVPDDAQRLLLCGFGVGLSWATCILEKTPC